MRTRQVIRTLLSWAQTEKHNTFAENERKPFLSPKPRGNPAGHQIDQGPGKGFSPAIISRAVFWDISDMRFRRGRGRETHLSSCKWRTEPINHVGSWKPSKWSLNRYTCSFSSIQCRHVEHVCYAVMSQGWWESWLACLVLPFAECAGWGLVQATQCFRQHHWFIWKQTTFVLTSSLFYGKDKISELMSLFSTLWSEHTQLCHKFIRHYQIQMCIIVNLRIYN